MPNGGKTIKTRIAKLVVGQTYYHDGKEYLVFDIWNKLGNTKNARMKENNATLPN